MPLIIEPKSAIRHSGLSFKTGINKETMLGPLGGIYFIVAFIGLTEGNLCFVEKLINEIVPPLFLRVLQFQNPCRFPESPRRTREGAGGLNHHCELQQRFRKLSGVDGGKSRRIRRRRRGQHLLGNNPHFQACIAGQFKSLEPLLFAQSQRLPRHL